MLPFQNENPFSKEGGFWFCIHNGSITNVRFNNKNTIEFELEGSDFNGVFICKRAV